MIRFFSVVILVSCIGALVDNFVGEGALVVSTPLLSKLGDALSSINLPGVSKLTTFVSNVLSKFVKAPLISLKCISFP